MGGQTVERTLGVLKVFIVKGCLGCKRALERVDWKKGMNPRLVVEIIDLAMNPNAGRNLVFAVPTYVYDSSPVFLGNPSKGQLMTWLEGLGGLGPAI